ncbi:MAG: ABC transporter ATP-binding protein [Eubacterium sp.]|nr:ABC transporter ATP-binding protein [Eubacterium sp.]
MISFEKVSFRYENGTEGCIKDLSFQIRKGECVLFCGESGCGKSTVTRMMNGLIPHFYEGEKQGVVRVGEMNISETPLETISRRVGSVFQNPRSQFFCVDTLGELAFGPENMCLPEEEILKRIRRVTKELELEKYLDRSIFDLSGGEKQKIACGSVSAVDPEVVVLDEPTANLDEEAIGQIREVVRHWKENGKTIIIAEHRLGWLRNIVDRVIYMKNGAIVLDLPGHEFFGYEDERLHQFGLRSIETRNNYLDYPSGIFCIKPESKQFPETSSDYILENFHYRYKKGGNVLAIDEIRIPEHAVVAIVGHNGAGKSTFSQCLCGIRRGFKGRVQKDGKKYTGKKLRQLTYMVMQDVNHQLFTDSVMEEVVLGMPREDEQLGEKVLRKMDLEDLKDRHPMSLSGGQKQRTAICSAYLSDRQIIIFDEPTSGLDFKTMNETADLIREISAEKTVFVVTHDMELIDRCCTHILHIEEGNIGCGERKRR